MLVFLILVTTVGGWTVEDCIACPANKVNDVKAMNDMKKGALQKDGLHSVLQPSVIDRDVSHPNSIKFVRLVVVGVCFRIACVLILLLGCT